MNLSAQRRSADLAVLRARTTAVAYRRSVRQLCSRLRRDWTLPLAAGMGTGMITGLLPLAATLRVGTGLARLIVSASQIPFNRFRRTFKSR